eukprot:SAG11_NODE_6554_length_1289_cov_3.355462_1_plen_248_part_10
MPQPKRRAQVADNQCVTATNTDGNCAPAGLSSDQCRQLLSDLLAGDNPGGATAAEYSGDGRQICWVIAGAAPRPNANGPYHCYHRFDCGDPGASCMATAGVASCPCNDGHTATTIAVSSVDHSSGLEGQYFNFDRDTIGLGDGQTAYMTVTVVPASGGPLITGEIVVWGGANGGSTGNAHGRFNNNPVAPAAGQFEQGDVLQTPCEAANPCDAEPCADPNSSCNPTGGTSYSCDCNGGFEATTIVITS